VVCCPRQENTPRGYTPAPSPADGPQAVTRIVLGVPNKTDKIQIANASRKHLSGLRLSTEKVVPPRDSSRVRRARRGARAVRLTSFQGRCQTTVVCTKHLLRLELETKTWSRHQRGEQQRLRGLETHRCPLTGRLKATGSGRRPVPVSTQLGRGAAHSSASQRRVIKSVERARESNQRTGLRDLRAQMLAAVGAARGSGASARARSHAGSS